MCHGLSSYDRLITQTRFPMPWSLADLSGGGISSSLPRFTKGYPKQMYMMAARYLCGRICGWTTLWMKHTHARSPTQKMRIYQLKHSWAPRHCMKRFTFHSQFKHCKKSVSCNKTWPMLVTMMTRSPMTPGHTAGDQRNTKQTDTGCTCTSIIPLALESEDNVENQGVWVATTLWSPKHTQHAQEEALQHWRWLQLPFMWSTNGRGRGTYGLPMPFQ